MKAKILMPIAMCILPFVLASCSDERCDKEDITFSLTEAEKKLWPLNETDSFKMRSNKNELMTFKGKMKKVSYYSETHGNPNCPYSHDYERLVLSYILTKDASLAWSVHLTRFDNMFYILSYIDDTTYSFGVPFSSFTPSQYQFNISTNKGVLSCLSVGDSLYYSQTEGIIRLVENDSTFWTREF